MAFDFLEVGDTFPGEVKLNVQNHNGEREDISFTAFFNRLEQSVITPSIEAIRHNTAVINAIDEGRIDPDKAKDLSSTAWQEIADLVLAGWGEDMLFGGKPWEFNPETKRKVVEFPGMARALCMAWMLLTAPGTEENPGKSPTSKQSRGNGFAK